MVHRIIFSNKTDELCPKGSTICSVDFYKKGENMYIGHNDIIIHMNGKAIMLRKADFIKNINAYLKESRIIIFLKDYNKDTCKWDHRMTITSANVGDFTKDNSLRAEFDIFFHNIFCKWP
jgi:hypothetical protein